MSARKRRREPLGPETGSPSIAGHDSDVSHGDVARGAGSAFLSRSGALVELVAQPAYVWMFGLTSYGLYTALWSLVNLVENAADLGMTSALQRVGPQARNEEEAVGAVRTALVLGVLPCVVLAALASVFAGSLATLFNAAPADRPHLATGIALFAWALPLWAFIEVGTSAVRARRAFGPEIRLRVFWEQIMRLGIAVPIWMTGLGTLGLLLAHLASLAATALICARLLSRYYDLRLMIRAPRNRRLFNDTLLAGLSVFPSNIVARLFGDAPPVILNLYFPGAAGAATAGLYGLARKLSSVVQMVRVALGYVVGPLASAVAARDRGRIEPLYAFATRLATVLALPLGLVLVAGAWRLRSLFGTEGQAAVLILVPLVLARLVDAVTGPGGAIQQVTSARSHPMVGSFLGLGVAAVLALLLLRPFGAFGMAVAVAGGLAASSVVTVVQLRLHDRVHPFGRPFGRVVAISGAVSVAACLLLAALPALPVPADIALVLAVQLAALWASVRYALPLEDRRTTGAFGQRIRLYGTE